MRNLLIILTLFLPFFSAFSVETTCECECHRLGCSSCEKCQDYHDRDECNCDCHQSGYTSCSHCEAYHDDVESIGLEQTQENAKLLHQHRSSVSRHSQKTQHQRQSHNTCHSKHQNNKNKR